jgi:hypothetical protein
VAQDAEPAQSALLCPADNVDASAQPKTPLKPSTAQSASHGTATETPADLQTLFESGSTTHLAAADLGATPAASTPSWGALIAQAGGAVGDASIAVTGSVATVAAATTGGGALGAFVAVIAAAAVVSNSGKNDATISPNESATPRKYSISALFGPPLTQAKAPKIYLYKATTGEKWEAVYNAATQKFEFTDATGYAGVVIAKLVDTDDSLDYMDEATGAQTDIKRHMAVINVTGSGAISININPLTTAAALKLGVAWRCGPKAPFLKRSSKATQAQKSPTPTKPLPKLFGVVDSSGAGVDIATITSTRRQ